MYHYTSFEAAQSILNTNCVWLSEFSKTNDGQEYTYAHNQYVNFYQNREIFVEEVPRYIATIALVTHQPTLWMMIGSLCEEKDDLTLWDRYADNASGCVIGIDAKWLETCADVTMRRVSYDLNYLRDFVNSGLLMLQEHYEENPEDRDELRELAIMFVLDLYAFKHPSFRSEHEVRISRLTIKDAKAEFGLIDPGGHTDSDEDTPKLQIKCREGTYGKTRYMELPLFDEITPSAILSVGLGPKAPIGRENDIRQLIIEDRNVKIWRSKIPLR